MPVDRRTLMKSGAAGVIGLVGGGAIGRELLAPGGSGQVSAAVTSAAVPFRGAHQAGIATPPPRHAAFAAFDMTSRERSAVAGLLASWTATAETLAHGRAVAGDSGEATGLGPAALTITFGFGASLFDDACAPRKARPSQLVDLPAFIDDQLDPRWNGGDLLVQVCAEDPTVVSHAVRQLRRDGLGVASLRWMQSGFLPAAPGKTPRNLFGQVDGTANPAPGSRAFDKLVWLGAGEGPDWMTGGTFLATRRIRMQLTMWDRMGLAVQEAAIGRHRASGAPLTGGDEHTPLDLNAKDSTGAPVIAETAHVRVAKTATTGMYRRGYSFDNGPRATGTAPADMTAPADHSAHAMGGMGGMMAAMDDSDVGLMFAAFVRDPAKQFIPAQKALSASDALGHFLAYTSAGLWAISGGTRSGPIARSLFA